MNSLFPQIKMNLTGCRLGTIKVSLKQLCSCRRPEADGKGARDDVPMRSSYFEKFGFNVRVSLINCRTNFVRYLILLKYNQEDEKSCWKLLLSDCPSSTCRIMESLLLQDERGAAGVPVDVITVSQDCFLLLNRK